MALLDELIAHRDEIYAIAARNGVEDIRVFGSVARREEREDSDIDFLVRMKEGRSLLDLVGFKLDMEDWSHHTCDVLTENSVHWYIRDSVFQEAKTL